MKPHWAFVFFAMAWGCTRETSPAQPENSAGEPAAASSTRELAARADAANAEPADAGEAEPISDAGAGASEAWSAFSRKDDIPVCILSNYAEWGIAQSLKKVKPKVSLKAGRELQFAAYPPSCASPECVRKVTMQCWIDVAGTTLTVNTRFSGEEIAGKSCTTNCDEETTAACSTPALNPGEYTLTYGAHTQTIRIPGVLRPTCFTHEP